VREEVLSGGSDNALVHKAFMTGSLEAPVRTNVIAIAHSTMETMIVLSVSDVGVQGLNKGRVAEESIHGSQ
jgi:hypothetical protein